MKDSEFSDLILAVVFGGIIFMAGFFVSGVVNSLSHEVPTIDEVVLKIQEYDKQVTSIQPSEEISEINNEIAKLSFIVNKLCPNERMFSEKTCYFFITREKSNTTEVDSKDNFPLSDTDLYYKQRQKVSGILSVFNEKYEIETSPKS